MTYYSISKVVDRQTGLDRTGKEIEDRMDRVITNSIEFLGRYILSCAYDNGDVAPSILTSEIVEHMEKDDNGVVTFVTENSHYTLTPID